MCFGKLTCFYIFTTLSKENNITYEKWNTFRKLKKSDHLGSLPNYVVYNN